MPKTCHAPSTRASLDRRGPNSYSALAAQRHSFITYWRRLMRLRSVVVIVLALSLGLATLPGRSAAGAVTREQQIAKTAEALREKLVERRRDFHMHPELSNREERTSRIVAERLRALGLDEVKTGVGKYGVVALLKGSKPGPVVAVR